MAFGFVIFVFFSQQDTKEYGKTLINNVSCDDDFNVIVFYFPYLCSLSRNYTNYFHEVFFFIFKNGTQIVLILHVIRTNKFRKD